MMPDFEMPVLTDFNGNIFIGQLADTTEAGKGCGAGCANGCATGCTEGGGSG